MTAEAELELSSDVAFRGDATLLNPEQLLLMALSSCQLLSFLAVAARQGVDVVAYQDSAVATMPVSQGWLTQAELRPVIEVKRPASLVEVLELVDRAHEECYIARSVRSEVVVRAQVKVV